MMRPKKYLLYLVAFLGLFFICNLAIYLIIDPFGLFRGRQLPDIKIYSSERLSKYYLTQRYVPEHFNSIILGPSLSDNLDPSEFPEYRVYNASLMGANVKEMRSLLNNVRNKGSIQYVYLCIDPYILKDNDYKSSAFSKSSYSLIFGSNELYRLYIIYFIREYELFPDRFAKDLYNSFGSKNYELEQRKVDVDSLIKSKILQDDFDPMIINEGAVQELSYLIKDIEAEGASLVAYYSPVPKDIYLFRKDLYVAFKSKVESVLPKIKIKDYNETVTYDWFVSDYNNYIDHGHLSKDGREFILRDLLSDSIVK